MATLDNIRKRGPLLVGVIGVALLAFVAGDFLNSGQTFLNRSREIVLEVNNEEVNIRTFQDAVDQMTEVYKIETGQSDLNENLQSQLRASVWESFVSEKLFQDEAEKLGLVVSKEELADRLLGSDVDPIIQQRRIFAGEDGQFSREALINFFRFLDEGSNSGDAQIYRFRNYWSYWENVVKNNLLQEKYNALMTKSITANGVDAKYSFEGRQKNVNFSYIAQPYYMISDSLVSVDDKEVSARYNKNKELYKQNESRSASYVTFDLKPQADDYTRVQEWMDKLVDEFKTTDDIVGLVNSNSDLMYDGRNYSVDMLPDYLKGFAFEAKVGDSFGPIFENDTHTMARLVENGIYTSDSIRLSHIYFSAEKIHRADSLFRALQKDKKLSFEALAVEFSEIEETAKNGGDIGWVTENARGLDKELLAAFHKGVNETFIIKNDQGAQIIKITDKTAPRKKVKLAVLQRKVETSSQTQARIFNEAKRFANDVKTLDDLKRLAEEKELTVLQASGLDKNVDRIADMPQTRQVVRWMYKAKVGDVSDVFDCDKRFVVAVLTEENKEGYMPLEKVSNMIKSELLKEKKADYATAQIAKLSQSSLEGLATALNLEVKTAERVNFSSYQFGTDGFEPFVIGRALAQDLNSVSAPIKGNFGVFVVQPTSVEDAGEEYNAKLEIENLNIRSASMYNSVTGRIYEDLKTKSNIKDNRSNFY